MRKRTFNLGVLIAVIGAWCKGASAATLTAAQVRERIKAEGVHGRPDLSGLDLADLDLSDLDFRKALLVDPRKAILDGLGVHIPASFRVKFIERDKEIDALIVLPDLQRQDGELDDGDLEAVAGGGAGDPTDPSAAW